ncbi:MAG: PEGA domain-containing protein [Proteobacteria bacterium]|nr:PEGA domain-containing protein [Pseudomonadota bacterium]
MTRWFSSVFACVMAVALTVALGGEASAQSDQNYRVMWQLDYGSLSKSQRSEVDSVVMQVLSRAKERHFVGEQIISQKIKKEGLNFPDCFYEGMPCSGGGAFMLDVFNVDAFAKASFAYKNNEWHVGLHLYRNLSSAPVIIDRSGKSLDKLLQIVINSLFELESGLDLISSIPNVEVYINQKLVGTTPLSMKTPVGEQVITFKKAGYVSETWRFTAEKGQVYSKTVELKPEVTELTVLTNDPEAVIYVDDEVWGNSNETKDILPGEHQIAVVSETHHHYRQSYKVYPGTPQTFQAALLPNSISPYEIRHRNIGKYRFSTTLGYHFAAHRYAFTDSIQVRKGEYTPKISETGYFHGITWAVNYEDEYWGIQLFRLDIAGAASDFDFNMDMSNGRISSEADGGVLIGFYPAQVKGHYTFWVMQAEAALGLGLSHVRLDGYNKNLGDFTLTKTSFSIGLSLGLKYFFSEESFAQLAYDIQFDTSDKSRPRHGLTLSVGMQIPVWMRSTTYSSDTAEENIISDIDSEAGMTGEKIVESEGVHKGDSHE